MNEQKSPYELIGGAAKVSELVDRFYDLMDLEASFEELRSMHFMSLSSSREKLKLFLSGWLGGLICIRHNLDIPVYGHAISPSKSGSKNAINGLLACIKL
jgi:hemoglobin